MSEISSDLRAVYSEHIDGYDELLLHLFVGDVLDFALETLGAQGAEDATLINLLKYLDHSFSAGDDDVVNAIAVSFLEGLPAVKPNGSQLAVILPRELASVLTKHEESRLMPDSTPPDLQRSRTGLFHFIDGLRYSLRGYRAAWQHAEAFRQELAIFAAAVVAAAFLGDTAVERAILIGILFPVLVAELVNTAIETVVDRVGVEHHELSGRAKDLASAAVFTAIIAAVTVWALVLIG